MLYNAHVTMKKEHQDIREDLYKKEKIISDQENDILRAKARYDEHNSVVEAKVREFD